MDAARVDAWRLPGTGTSMGTVTGGPVGTPARAVRPRRIKALVLDFDSTISTPTFLARLNDFAVADKRDIFGCMTVDEQWANFGGAERVQQLTKLLAELQAAGVVLHIVSIGFRSAFMPHLRTVGLLDFFAQERVFGQDSLELRAVGFVKGQLIGQLMAASSWEHDDVLFVDDSRGHIEQAADVCRVLLVSPESKSSVGGMAQAELDAIRSAALG